MLKKILFLAACLICAGLLEASTYESVSISNKIAATCKVLSQDQWYGFNRIKFLFKGKVAWVVEPKDKVLKDKPWTWTMQWAEAYVKRTGVPEALKIGYHHATIELFETRMNDEGVEIAAQFQRYLVDALGFAPKVNLIGMSWGGFFSIRYASKYPECIKSIYLDAPLLSFDSFAPNDAPTKAAMKIGPWALMAPESGKWIEDERMPINNAEKIALAKIPVLLLYGAQDQTVKPELNALVFIDRFKKAGGSIKVIKRGMYGHHPHGVDLDETELLLKFFAQ
ncbi:MAG: alpha/beta fold hydrolase [Kiritimatiellae bacterium]|nr:alpha/beta fold hydrolase [Kiritimatiellia bacterium]